MLSTQLLQRGNYSFAKVSIKQTNQPTKMILPIVTAPLTPELEQEVPFRSQ